MVAHVSFGDNGALWRGVVRTSGKPSIFFKKIIYGSSVGTDIVTVSLGEVTAQPGCVRQETAESCSLFFVRWVAIDTN